MRDVPNLLAVQVQTSRNGHLSALLYGDCEACVTVSPCEQGLEAINSSVRHSGCIFVADVGRVSREDVRAACVSSVADLVSRRAEVYDLWDYGVQTCDYAVISEMRVKTHVTLIASLADAIL